MAFFAKARLWLLFFLSMGVHILADFPLHHDDAHRHFSPLSDWRFESPVSYWDPAHYGVLMSSLEAVAVAIGCVVLFKCVRTLATRTLVTLVAGSYMAYFGFAWLVWG